MSIVYLASQNKHKAEEIQAILAGIKEIRPCNDLTPGIQWDETGTTFPANALIKAQAVLDHGAEEVLADDSGLEVEILGNAPGIYSARYAGPTANDEDNNLKLLQELTGKDGDSFPARFVCVLCYVKKGQEPQYFTGICQGRIVRRAKGLKGFGYDPLFIPDGYDQSFAELGDSIKNRISHRAQALDLFKAHLASSLS